jgi:hypothetical protein
MACGSHVCVCVSGEIHTLIAVGVSHQAWALHEPNCGVAPAAVQSGAADAPFVVDAPTASDDAPIVVDDAPVVAGPVSDAVADPAAADAAATVAPEVAPEAASPRAAKRPLPEDEEDAVPPSKQRQVDPRSPSETPSPTFVEYG